MQCVIYARVSTREQEEHGYSIPYQLGRCRKKAAQEKLTVVDEFVEAESASKQGRPGFARMVKFLKDHPETGTILCHKVDRLCRNLFDIIEVRKLERSLSFVQEEYADNASGELHFGLKVLLAEHYSKNLSEEVRKGLQAKFEMGLYPSQAPRGYKTVRSEDGKARLVPDTKVAPILTWIFETYATGKWSLREISEEAAYRGLLTKNSKPLSSERIKSILQKKLYSGLIEWDGVVRKGKHKPIVSEPLFAQVQKALKKRSSDTRPSRNGKLPFLLRGLLICECCGRKLTAERHPRGSYYRCVGPSFSLGRCREPYAPVKLLDDQVEALLKTLKPSDQLKKQLRQEWDEMVMRSKDKQKNTEEPLRQSLNKADAQRSRLAEAYAAGNMPLDVYKKTSQKVENERQRILEQLEELGPDNPEAIREELEKSLEFADSFWPVYEQGNIEEKQEILGVLFKELKVQNREITNYELNEPLTFLFTR